MVDWQERSFWRRLNPFAETQRARVRGQAQSAEQFRLALERECARARQSGYGFTLVVFEHASEDGDVDEKLLDLLTKRLRVTDEIGWVDERRLGALLYTTPTEGARRFGEKTLKTLDDDGVSRRFTVYSFPEHWIDAFDAAPGS